MIFRRFYMWIDKYLLGIDNRLALERAIANGMKVGDNPNFQDGIIFDPSHCWLITIGNNVTISPRVRILCHDASTKLPLGYTKIGKFIIGNNVFIGANTTALPSVTIGNNCIIGANSVVTKISVNSVAVGNPCRVIKTYDEYINENRKLMRKAPIFDKKYTIDYISDEQKLEMNTKLKQTIGFIE